MESNLSLINVADTTNARGTSKCLIESDAGLRIELKPGDWGFAGGEEEEELVLKTNEFHRMGESLRGREPSHAGLPMNRLTRPIRIERDIRYEGVWTESMSSLAKQHNLANVALARVCRKLKLPVLPRCDWARARERVHGEQARSAENKY